MGKLIWHHWGRFIALAASLYTVWAGYWAIFYRKFFWDFVGGILRNPGGLQPARGAAFFITIIVKLPLVQILMMLVGAANVCIYWPLPIVKKYPVVYNNLIVRIVGLFIQILVDIIVYQGTNGALYSFIAIIVFTRAIFLGEQIEEAKNNRGKTGQV